MTKHRTAQIDQRMLGKVLEGTLTKRGLSMRSAEPEMDVSFSTIGRVVAGKGCDLAAYVRICDWLNVSLDTFVTHTEVSR